ncbi:MAG TPA: flagellar hook-associated protein FlgK [Candidatus Sulfotelmatobacter sp.]|nr:flagellar hook-associated protein FlgK [Candidatus Sulfotelmatobacter sp.]
MGTLTASLNTALSSMLAQQGAIDTATNNIANVDTPGYSRQVANLEESPTIQEGDLTYGTGVQLASVTSLRDAVLDVRTNQETAQQGQLNAFIGAGQQVQALFNETSGTGLQSSLTAFFNSFSDLASDPSDPTTRQNVLTAAQNLTGAINQTSSNLSTLQTNADLSVQQSVSQINSLTSQIAQVNQEVVEATQNGQNPGPAEDQRQQLINQLSNYIGVSETDAGDGSLTLSTANGSALVVGNQSFALSTQTNANGFQDIYSNGQNITSQISGGSLAGNIQIRDQEIPAFQNSLDTLAYDLTTAVNKQNQAGYDLHGDPGGDIFTPLTQVQGAAANMGVVMTDPDLIAASGTAGTVTDGVSSSSGDNTNANALYALQNSNMVDGQTPISYYSGMVFKIGNDVSTAQTNEQAGSQALQQLQNLQGGVSGVDINQEAANLVQFQNAYQAAAQVVTVINSLLETTINMMDTATV